ncbi:FadR/GntR family transcriptional regulator [Rugosimonospora africana]|uniref:GntR family transcriptional regulator n=1 Tax=Rugosimonospora africana TaxID=556532 RepID=A0A8J3VNF9_9ACTN|nr:FCD domain-containing protein [Rugosimonospora africana]GIH12777.1 GntR family transcriptional regulator [Rugosimonospora africana]
MSERQRADETVRQHTRVPAYQLLADDLRSQITSGVLRPGDRLPTEPELCAHRGVSRSTVREALRLLSSQRLIITTRGVTGGSFVAVPNPSELAESMSAGVRLLLSTSAAGVAELMEVREMLEVPAAGLAARRRTEADLERLRSTMFDPENDELPVRLAAHRAFHVALAAAAGNPLYELVTGPLYAITEEVQQADLAPQNTWLGIDAEHREILRCVAAGDGPAAERAVTWHLARLHPARPGTPHRPVVPEQIRAGRRGPATAAGVRQS